MHGNPHVIMKLIYSKYLLLLNKNTLFDFILAFILNQSQRNKLFVRNNSPSFWPFICVAVKQRCVWRAEFSDYVRITLQVVLVYNLTAATQRMITLIQQFGSKASLCKGSDPRCCGGVELQKVTNLSVWVIVWRFKGKKYVNKTWEKERESKLIPRKFDMVKNCRYKVSEFEMQVRSLSGGAKYVQSEVTGTATKVNHIVQILRDTMLRPYVIYFPSTTMLRWLVRNRSALHL